MSDTDFGHPGVPRGAPPDLAAVEVVEVAAADRPVLERLLRSYLRELSLYEGTPIEDAGDYPHLHLYGEEPGRHAFLVRVRGRPAGFALVRRVDHGADVMSVMAEFYVAPAHRRAGVGRAAATRIFRRFPGPWRVRQLVSNRAARAFWRAVLEELDPGWRERGVEGGRAVLAELVVRRT